MSEYSDEQDYERHLVSLDSLPLHNQATRYYGPIGEPVHRDTLRSDWPRLMDPPYGNGFGHSYDPNQRDFLVNHVHELNQTQHQSSRFLRNIIPPAYERQGNFSEYQMSSFIDGVSTTFFYVAPDGIIEDMSLPPHRGPNPETLGQLITRSFREIITRFNLGEECCQEETIYLHDCDDGDDRELEDDEILATVRCRRRCDYHMYREERREAREMRREIRREHQRVQQFVQQCVMAALWLQWEIYRFVLMLTVIVLDAIETYKKALALMLECNQHGLD